MECCCSGPNLRPPLQQHHHRHHRHHRHRILPWQAAIPHFHPLASIPSLASPAAAARRRRVVLISSSTSSPVVTSPAAAAAPEEEPREGGALPPSSTTSATSSDGYLNTFSSRRRRRRAAALAAATLGIAAAAFMAGAVDGEAALALGPEGPLVEEFWDNVRRYGLYALTVSTGAIYAVLEPVVELLKSPLSAILLLVILGGSFYLLSQVLSFMVGINEFSYDYAN